MYLPRNKYYWFGHFGQNDLMDVINRFFLTSVRKQMLYYFHQENFENNSVAASSNIFTPGCLTLRSGEIA